LRRSPAAISSATTSAVCPARSAPSRGHVGADRAARPGPDPLDGRRARRPQRGGQRDQQSARECQGHGERDDARVDRRVEQRVQRPGGTRPAQPGRVAGAAGGEGARRGPREGQPEQPAGGREREHLGDHHARDLPLAGAEGAADGELVPARGCARQLQRAQVRGRNE
jgi:hypothetical protein